MKRPLGEDEIAFLRSRHIAVVSTFRSDGSISSVATWVDADDLGRVNLNTLDRRVWRRNLLRDPRLTVAVTEGALGRRYLAVSGVVTESDYEGAEDHLDRISHRYLGEPYPNRASGDLRVRLVMAPERIVRFGFLPA